MAPRNIIRGKKYVGHRLLCETANKNTGGSGGPSIVPVACYSIRIPVKSLGTDGTEHSSTW